MNLEELFDNISNSKFTNLLQLKNILEKYNCDDYKLYIKKPDQGYYRFKIHMDLEKNYEVLILTWPPNIKSKIHDHPHNGCLLKVLQGNLIENIYNKDLELIKTNNFDENNISYIHDSIGYHEICNNTDEYCVSLHIYSPIFYKPKYYN